MNLITILQIILFILFFSIIIFVLKRENTLKKEKRINSYSLEPVVDNSVNMMDRLIGKYKNFVKRMRPYIKKVNYFKKASKRYDRYISYDDKDEIENVDFITNKLVISAIFIIITILSQAITLKVFPIYELVIYYFMLFQ